MCRMLDRLAVSVPELVKMVGVEGLVPGTGATAGLTVELLQVVLVLEVLRSQRLWARAAQIAAVALVLVGQEGATSA